MLVNNAGFSTTGPVYRSDRDREMAMIRTDVEAVVDLCSIFLPGMVERGRGAVLNVASTAAFQPLPGQAGYGASKAFVLSYSRAVRAELRGTGVTLTALCPGPVKTEFAESAGFTKEESENSLPKIMWLPAAEVARARRRGHGPGQGRGDPRLRQPGGRRVRPQRAAAGPGCLPGPPAPRPQVVQPGPIGGADRGRGGSAEVGLERRQGIGETAVGDVVLLAVVHREDVGPRHVVRRRSTTANWFTK